VAGVPCLAIRVSFTGDLGWELHCATDDQVKLYTALLDAAREFGGGPVGSRALGSLRIEKGYGSWSREYSPEYWPQEVGLDRLVKLDKDFLHKDAYLAVKDKPARETLSVFEVEATNEADATGGEPVFTLDGRGVGRVTSGAYGYSVGKSLALGFVRKGSANPGDTVEIHILGKPHRATILAEPPFDPSGARLRG
jgi:dimethylglycine dehydrogenase